VRIRSVGGVLVNENKTKSNRRSVETFLKRIPDEGQRRDCQTLVEWMGEASGEEPVMWGASVIGFGKYHYRYASGREGDWFVVGVSPRKQNLTLYLMNGVGQQRELLAKLGKHKIGVGCLYIKSLDDVHRPTLRQLIRKSVKEMRKLAVQP
jgi:hypothetical protein